MVTVEEIKQAIREREFQIEKKFNKEEIIPRDIPPLREILTTDLALVVTGVRRSGKSVLSFMLGRKMGDFAYVNFEDERLFIDAKELNKVMEAIYGLKGDVEVIIFDEIQNVEGWEKFISRIIQSKKVIITGSNARLLSGELATHLTGRHIDYNLFPFSFKEFLRYKKIEPDPYLTKNIAQIKTALEDYMEIGGFPLAFKAGKIFLIENFQDIIERDIMQRHSIREKGVFRELAKYLLNNLGREISFNKLKNIFKVNSVNTIKNYFSYFQEAFLIFTINRFSFKLKKQHLSPRKVYAVDHGFYTSGGFRISPDKGKIIENIVAVELMRRYKSLKTNTEIFYWKDYQQREVDFIVKKGEKIDELIQVSFAYGPDDIKEREITSLLKGSEELTCTKLNVITWECKGEETIKGKQIHFIPMWKWLLGT